MMPRLVEREWLDELPPDDPSATRSRRDLRWLNAWMGNGSLVARRLRELPRRPSLVLDLGAGDGRFMLGVARRLSRDWVGTRLRLVDKHLPHLAEVERDFVALGWQVEQVAVDVLEAFNDGDNECAGAMVANLFLHHFSRQQLAGLFGRIAGRTQALIAVEPRRSLLALVASRLVGLIGCNRVTRHDAPVSVRAGFTGRELSELWPAGAQWNLREGRAGSFSHVFIARRLDEDWPRASRL